MSNSQWLMRVFVLQIKKTLGFLKLGNNVGRFIVLVFSRSTGEGLLPYFRLYRSVIVTLGSTLFTLLIGNWRLSISCHWVPQPLLANEAPMGRSAKWWASIGGNQLQPEQCNKTGNNKKSLGVRAFAILVGPMRSIIATVSLCDPVFRPVDVLAVMYSPPASCAAKLLSLLSCLIHVGRPHELCSVGSAGAFSPGVKRQGHGWPISPA
jgi:hypothetical protein